MSMMSKRVQESQRRAKSQIKSREFREDNASPLLQNLV